MSQETRPAKGARASPHKVHASEVRLWGLVLRALCSGQDTLTNTSGKNGGGDGLGWGAVITIKAENCTYKLPYRSV